MFANSKLRFCLPAIAILVTYSAFVGLPKRREISQARLELSQSESSVTKATSGLILAKRRIDNLKSQVDGLNEAESVESADVSYESDTLAGSPVESATQLLAILENHGLTCLKIGAGELLDDQPSDGAQHDNDTQQVALVGRLTSMTSALDTIRDELPELLVASLEMRLDETGHTCQWSLVVSRTEGAGQ